MAKNAQTWGRETARKRYAEGGAAMERAKDELTRRMSKDHAERSDMTMIERDRDDATKDAFRRGDYAPQGNWASKLGYQYKPWNPKRGD